MAFQTTNQIISISRSFFYRFVGGNIFCELGIHTLTKQKKQGESRLFTPSGVTLEQKRQCKETAKANKGEFAIK